MRAKLTASGSTLYGFRSAEQMAGQNPSPSTRSLFRSAVTRPGPKPVGKHAVLFRPPVLLMDEDIPLRTTETQSASMLPSSRLSFPADISSREEPMVFDTEIAERRLSRSRHASSGSTSATPCWTPKETLAVNA